MLNLLGAAVLFILGWLALQALIVGVSMIFHWLNDSYYSAERWSKALRRKQSLPPEQ